ncbi:N-acetylmuramoyl-L-alanine amidase, partial [Clostridium botulinum]|nr:N-acetylmuramoyl-L-alanine amidase [Clostridium botulinum]
VEDIHRCHKENGWSGIGYHFFVRKDGSIYKGRPEGVLGSHCKGHNQNSLGICAEGDYMKEFMPQTQKNAIINLCKYLCNKYGITDVRGHKEAPYSTNCPGTNYPLQEIKQAINGKAYNANIQSNFNYGIVTATVLNVRDKATTNSNIIGQLKNGQQVHIFKKVGDWYSIYYGQHG